MLSSSSERTSSHPPKSSPSRRRLPATWTADLPAESGPSSSHSTAPSFPHKRRHLPSSSSVDHEEHQHRRRPKKHRPAGKSHRSAADFLHSQGVGSAPASGAWPARPRHSEPPRGPHASGSGSGSWRPQPPPAPAHSRRASSSFSSAPNRPARAEIDPSPPARLRRVPEIGNQPPKLVRPKDDTDGAAPAAIPPRTRGPLPLKRHPDPRPAPPSAAKHLFLSHPPAAPAASSSARPASLFPKPVYRAPVNPILAPRPRPEFLPVEEVNRREREVFQRVMEEWRVKAGTSGVENGGRRRGGEEGGVEEEAEEEVVQGRRERQGHLSGPGSEEGEEVSSSSSSGEDASAGGIGGDDNRRTRRRKGRRGQREDREASGSPELRAGVPGFRPSRRRGSRGYDPDSGEIESSHDEGDSTDDDRRASAVPLGRRMSTGGKNKDKSHNPVHTAPTIHWHLSTSSAAGAEASAHESSASTGSLSRRSRPKILFDFKRHEFVQDEDDPEGEVVVSLEVPERRPTRPNGSGKGGHAATATKGKLRKQPGPGTRLVQRSFANAQRGDESEWYLEDYANAPTKQREPGPYICELMRRLHPEPTMALTPCHITVSEELSRSIRQLSGSRQFLAIAYELWRDEGKGPGSSRVLLRGGEHELQLGPADTSDDPFQPVRHFRVVEPVPFRARVSTKGDESLLVSFGDGASLVSLGADGWVMSDCDRASVNLSDNSKLDFTITQDSASPAAHAPTAAFETLAARMDLIALNANQPDGFWIPDPVPIRGHKAPETFPMPAGVGLGYDFFTRLPYSAGEPVPFVGDETVEAMRSFIRANDEVEVLAGQMLTRTTMPVKEKVIARMQMRWTLVNPYPRSVFLRELACWRYYAPVLYHYSLRFELALHLAERLLPYHLISEAELREILHAYDREVRRIERGERMDFERWQKARGGPS
ncbi:hypothetical protein JCM8202v2_006261 [Rhodotorula sphaerocarpa]